ncbi:MAG: hypothetical protein ACOVOO_10615 [Flavobacteriales bacterium]
MKQLLFFACMALLISCAPQAKPEEKKSEEPTVQADTNLTGMAKADMMARKNAGKGVLNNTANALIYLQSGENLNLWGSMVAGSKWGKEVAQGKYLVMAPTNELLRALDQELLYALVEPQNEDLLNEFVGAHMILPPFSVEKAEFYPEVKNALGKSYKVDWGQSRINEILYANQIPTEKGEILVVREIMNFPAQEIQKRLKSVASEKEKIKKQMRNS